MLFLSNVDTSLTLFFNRIVYVGPILALLFFSLFIDTFYFPPAKRLKWLNIISWLIALPTVAISFTSLNVASVSPRYEQGEVIGYNVVPGRLAIFIAIVLFALSISLFVRLFLAYKSADERQRKPLHLIVRTLILAVAVSLATNVLGPLIFGGSTFGNAISNLTIIIFVSSVAYSVLKYSFLDVKLLVVRSVGYVAGLLAIFGLVIFLQVILFNLLGGGHHSLDSVQLWIFVLVVTIATLSFGPLRALFVKGTAKLLFKDTYDPSVFISSFNANLVNNIDIDKLLTESSRLIEQTLKSTFCTIGIKETVHTPRYVVGTRNVRITQEDERIVTSYISHSSGRVFVKALLKRDLASQAMDKMMARYDIEVLVRLVATSGSKENGIGYIVLGPKKSSDPYNQTDINMLAIVANELVLAVQNALRFEEIQNFNATLQDKIEDATKQLRRTNDKLRKLDETKDDFISMASHQLRTPLTSVKGYVSMVLDGDAGKITDLQRKLLTQSFISSQRMVYLISDLLNVSRLRTGKFIIEATPTNLARVIDEEIDQLVETAKGRNLELTFHKPEHFPTLMLDDTKMRQVIMNFIDNAVYYTPSGGHITVNLVDRPHAIEFTVVDDGIGVPRHEQHHLFSKFFRAHNAKRARPDGTGLGLFMAKKVIIAQGGAVIFKSQEGRGSTFGFTFAKDKLLPPGTVITSGIPSPKPVANSSKKA